MGIVTPKTAEAMKQMLQQKAEHDVAVRTRALTVFEQLLQIPQFMEWMKEHITIRDEVDHEKKEIVTYIIYSDGEKEEVDEENDVSVGDSGLRAENKSEDGELESESSGGDKE